MKTTLPPAIPEEELKFSFIRASGPGGQNINKVATAVQLRFDVSNSPSLPGEIKQRLIKLAGARMTRDGEVVLDAKRYRSQERNRADAVQRLMHLIEKASQQPKVRHATRPSLASNRKRMESKKRHAAIKKERQSVNDF